MKPIVHFRIIVAVTLSFLCGIATSFFAPVLKGWSALVFGVPFAASVAYALALNKGKPNGKIVAASVTCFIAAVCGFARMEFYVGRIYSGAVPKGDYVVDGEVKKISVKSGEIYLELENCRYDEVPGGDISVRVSGVDFDLYDQVRMVCYAEPSEMIDENGYTYAFSSGVPMRAARVSSIEKTGLAGGVLKAFKRNIDRVFDDVGGPASGVSKALITGDTSDIDESEIEGFRMAGVAHIFAVSGMHVWLLYIALQALTSGIKIHKMVKNLLISALLLFYSGVCGFSASSLRAVVACTVVGICKSSTVGGKYDRLNGLSIAAFIITAIDPSQLFSAGFILSFAVSLSLISFTVHFRDLLSFIPGKPGDNLSVILAAEVMSFPLAVNYFGYFPLAAIIGNIAIVPFVSILYYFEWAVVVTGLIVPGIARYVAFVPGAIAYGLTGIASFISSFGLSVTYFPDALKCVYYPFALLSCDFFNFGKRLKIAGYAGMSAVVLFAVIASL